MSLRKSTIPFQQPQQIKQITNQRNFQRWIQKHNVNSQTPLIIQNSFRNFEDPLQYIRDQKIKILQNQSNNLVNDMKFQRQSISQMSKSTYKKVISRQKVDYQFGNTSNLKNNLYHGSYHQSHKRQAKKKDQNIKTINKRDQLTKQFIHNYNRTDLDNKNQLKKLTLDIIRDIDSKDFQIKHSNVQYFDIFLKQQDQKLVSAYTDISQNYQMDQLFSKLKFNVIDKDSYYSEKSTQYLFKPDQQLDFWRRYSSNQNIQVAYADQIQIMKRCHNFDIKQPSFLHLLDFAAGKLDGQILSSFFKLKSKHQAQLKINQNDQNLQQQYNRKKQQYDFLRQMKMKDKTQRVAIKYTKNTAQTIDNLEDLSFDSYFQQSARDLILRIKELNQIRDNVMQKNQNQDIKKVMLINIGHQIKNLLFKLLSLTLQGQSFVNYEQIMDIPQQNLAQKKILEIVYHQFHKITQLEVDSIPKTQILDIYLEERQKNQRMFQLLGRVYGQEKPTPVSKRKTTTATTTKPVIKNKK